VNPDAIATSRTGEPFEGVISRRDVVDRINAHPLGDEPTEQRDRFARLALGDRGTRASLDEVGITFDGDGGTVFYFHGGGYAFGSPRTHERIGRAFAQRTGFQVVVPKYPLAPEHCWPAQLEAALVATQSVEGPIVLAGDSAGGHLALVTALELGRLGKQVAGLVLFSPNTDRSGMSMTRERNNPSDPMVDDDEDLALARQCFEGMPKNHRHVSPLLDELSLLPPVHIEVGEGEVLLGDSLLLAERARASGCNVNLHVDPEGLHMGQLWAPWWPVASKSLDRAAAFAVNAVD